MVSPSSEGHFRPAGVSLHRPKHFKQSFPSYQLLQCSHLSLKHFHASMSGQNSAKKRTNWCFLMTQTLSRQVMKKLEAHEQMLKKVLISIRSLAFQGQVGGSMVSPASWAASGCGPVSHQNTDTPSMWTYPKWWFTMVDRKLDAESHKCWQQGRAWCANMKICEKGLHFTCM